MNKFIYNPLILATCLTLSSVSFASTASPKQITTLVAQADQERASGKLEQAVKDYEQIRQMTLEVIKENPNSAKAYYYLAQVNNRLGRKEEAKQALDKAKSLDPNLDPKYNSPQKTELKEMFN